MFAEMERVYATERAAHARHVRKANGQQVGRKKAHSSESIEFARMLRGQGHSITEVATKTGIPRSSLHRYLTGDSA